MRFEIVFSGDRGLGKDTKDTKSKLHTCTQQQQKQEHWVVYFKCLQLYVYGNFMHTKFKFKYSMLCIYSKAYLAFVKRTDNIRKISMNRKKIFMHPFY